MYQVVVRQLAYPNTADHAFDLSALGSEVAFLGDSDVRVDELVLDGLDQCSGLGGPGGSGASSFVGTGDGVSLCSSA